MMLAMPRITRSTILATRDPGTHHRLEILMSNEKGPNIKKMPKCKNCEGKGLLKKGTRW